MKTFTVTVSTRIPTTNDRGDGFGDFPNYSMDKHIVEAESGRKAVNILSKNLGRKLSTSGVGANTFYTEND